MLSKGSILDIVTAHEAEGTTAPQVDPSLLRVFCFTVGVGAPLHFCVGDEAVPLPMGSCQGHSAVAGSSAMSVWVTGACFGHSEMDRRGDLSNDLLSAALTPAFCLSLVSADWDYSRHGGWAAEPPASA